MIERTEEELNEERLSIKELKEEQIYNKVNNIVNKNFSNNNLVINPNFKINQRDGYITKLGCKVYNEPALITDVSNLGFSNIERQVTYRMDTFAAFLGDNGYTYYVSIDDIEVGYTRFTTNNYGSKMYTFDRWYLRGYTTLKLENDGVIFKKLKPSNQGYALFGTIIEDSKNMEGKELTLQASINGVVKKATISEGWVYDGNEKVIGALTWGVPTVTLLTTGGSFLEIRFYYANALNENVESKINWVKLEYGDVATDFLPPSTSSELNRCKFFYQEITGAFAPTVYGDNIIYAEGYFENMRIYPNYYFKNTIFNEIKGSDDKKSGVAIVSYWGGVAENFTFSAYIGGNLNRNPKSITLMATKENHGFMNNAYFVVGQDNPMCLDAEIY